MTLLISCHRTWIYQHCHHIRSPVTESQSTPHTNTHTTHKYVQINYMLASKSHTHTHTQIHFACHTLWAQQQRPAHKVKISIFVRILIYVVHPPDRRAAAAAETWLHVLSKLTNTFDASSLLSYAYFRLSAGQVSQCGERNSAVLARTHKHTHSYTYSYMNSAHQLPFHSTLMLLTTLPSLHYHAHSFALYACCAHSLACLSVQPCIYSYCSAICLQAHTCAFLHSYLGVCALIY